MNTSSRVLACSLPGDYGSAATLPSPSLLKVLFILFLTWVTIGVCLRGYRTLNEIISKDIGKETSSQAMDVKDLSKEVDQKEEIKDVKKKNIGKQTSSQAMDVKDSSQEVDQKEEINDVKEKNTGKQTSSQAMDVTDSSKEVDQKKENKDVKEEYNGKQTSSQATDETDSSKEVDKEEENNGKQTSSQAMDVTDPSKEVVQKKEDKDVKKENKDVYREVVEVSDSDSEDSESSSVSSLSSPSKSDSESDSDIECSKEAAKTKKGSYLVIKAKGELLPEDLPPIEELHISVPSSLCAEIGIVTSIVKTLVVIQSFKGVPALDLDSVLFLDSGSRALGLVFDVFGPVTEPLYCVRFNSEEQIAEYKVNPGDKVYYAPKTEHSKYVFLQQLLRMKGSDASDLWDVERQVQIEYSDDEEEKKAIAQFGDEILAEEEGLDFDQLKRKRDPNEVVGKKKKFAQFPPRSQRGGTGRWQSSSRTRPQQLPGPQHRQAHGRQYNPPPPHQGPIHPPLFNVPPPPIPVSAAQHQHLPPPPPNNSQGAFSNTFYPNPMQQQSACFGQLPFVQPQMDPRIAQFGAQFAQMVCNLQNSTPSGPVGALPTVAPSFTTPYTQSLYTDSQSTYNAFYKAPSQGQQGTYSAPPFSTPPPLPQSNLPSIHVPPPGHPSFPPQPNQNATFGGQFSSSYSSYPNLR